MAKELQKIDSISEFHRRRGLRMPEHPLISWINYADIQISPEYNNISWVYDFYFISLKRNLDGKIRYGHQHYDLDEGTMVFIAPGQVFSIEANQSSPNRTGWMLLLHPDFLWNTPLAKTIKNYEYFGYAVNEALFLSEKEEMVINQVIGNIKNEYHAHIDKFTQQIIISHLEVLLNYAERFYHRQFLTRKKSNHQMLDRLDQLLDDHFKGNTPEKGLPTVQYIAGQLNISPDYLSSLLKVSTGRNTQQHIHEKLIEKAKEKLTSTDLSVSVIAYELGFEHSQSFSKLFKSKTNLSPLEFRKSFN